VADARQLLAAGAWGYLLGSLPFAVWIGRRHGVDPRVAGDRNAGGTNVWCIAGWRAGLVVLALDHGKGAAAAVIGLRWAGWWGAAAATLAAMAGHAWPWWSHLRRGGRAAAVLVGAAPVLAPGPAALAAAAAMVTLPAGGVHRAAGAGLLTYPAFFALSVRDRRRLLAIGACYLVLLIRNRPGR
jgi:acyl phosphate:glycerol-3-phosphate acyltransferase